MKRSGAEIIAITAQIAAYILGAIIIVQILRIILGGSWKVEDAILALLVLNITLTFGLFGYFINSNTVLNDKISSVNTKIEGHLEWHKGKEQA